MKKTVFITGAGSGIGKDTVFALAKRGHQVIASTHTEEQKLSLQKEIEHTGINVETIKLDILNENDRRKIETYSFDVLINNAGVGESGSLAEISIDRLRHNFEVNVFCALALTQLALKKMVADRRGTVLFMSSLAARAPMAFLAPYCMSKAALSNGVMALRDEMHKLCRDINIVVVEPGAYHTGFNQRNINKKYEWMNHDSVFYEMIPEIKKREEKLFGLLELRSTNTIVRQIVKACESSKPAARYTAPWWQAFGLYLIRLGGR